MNGGNDDSQKEGRPERGVPCGSGKKFKQCCETKMQGLDRKSRVVLAALASIVAAAMLFGIASVARNGNSDGAGPRQVWSPEHGHYHTIP